MSSAGRTESSIPFGGRGPSDFAGASETAPPAEDSGDLHGDLGATPAPGADREMLKLDVELAEVNVEEERAALEAAQAAGADWITYPFDRRPRNVCLPPIFL